MRVRIRYVGLAMGLLPIVASAQDGLRSASLPETSLTMTPPATHESREVFFARPGTYRPNRNRVLLPFSYGYAEPPYPGAPQVIVVQIPRESTEPASAAPPSSPYVPGPAGPRKVFYVIPRCYAGDRPPEPGILVPGCNPSLLRVIPPL